MRTIRFFGEKGEIKGITAVRVTWEKLENGSMELKDVPGSEFEIPADLVLLSMGFIHPEHKGIIEDINLSLDRNGNIIVNEDYMTSGEGVFSAGDSVRGASLVVWAIHQGREAAKGINRYLMSK